MIKQDVVVCIAQIILLYSVIFACIFNLSYGTSNTNLWTMLLTSGIGYMMPSPNFKSNVFRASNLVSPGELNGTSTIAVGDVHETSSKNGSSNSSVSIDIVPNSDHKRSAETTSHQESRNSRHPMLEETASNSSK